MWAVMLETAAKALGSHILPPGDAQALQTSVHRFASGFGIHMLSRQPRRLHGKEGYAILDEAALSEDPEGFMEAVAAFLTWGRGKVAVISTESGGTECGFHKWRRAIENGQPDFADWSLHKTTIHDAVREGLHERVSLKEGWPYPIKITMLGGNVDPMDPKRLLPPMDRERARAVLAGPWLAKLKRANRHHWDSQFLCLPVGAGDVFFNRSTVEANMVETAPVLRFEAPAGLVDQPEAVGHALIDAFITAEVLPQLARLDKTRQHALGGDYGRTGDITAIAPIVSRLDGPVVPFMVELRNTPNDLQVRVYRTLIEGLPRFGKALIDAGGVGSGVAETLRAAFGTMILPVNIGVGKFRPPAKRPERSVFYSEILPPLKAAWQDRALPIPADTDVLDDIMGAVMVDGMPRVPTTRTKAASDGKQRHCDALVALALAYHAIGCGQDDWRAYEPVDLGDRWAM
jgi:phage FluMu gp28-like protein